MSAPATKPRKRRIAASPVAPEPVAIAYKAFKADWTCREYQYKLGETFVHDGKVKACASGFHACENPLDMFSYYEPGLSRFAVVELTGKLSRRDDDSKVAAARIHIKAEIGIPEIVSKTIAWITALCKPAEAKHAEGDRSASSATGDRSASSATGDQSASSATGYRSASSATGDRSASSATGDWSASSATGDQSASSATGYQSASSATGDWSASSATGDWSASSATGDQSASSATGYQSASTATGKAAVALNTGRDGRARAAEGGAIVICNHADDGSLRHIFASRVGDNDIKPDAWYTLGDDGVPQEVA